MCKLKSKYNSKKNSTKKNRNIGFELSFQEYKVLIESSTTCDYTQEHFSEEDDTLFKSIERIDKNLPYRKDNCCVVTVKANQVKDVIEKDTGKFSINDLETINKIKETLQNKTRLQLAGKYFPELLTQEDKPVPEETTIQENHLDLSIANSYVERCKNIEGFGISFGKYKQKYLKKTCDVTGKPFDQNQHPLKKQFLRIDKNKGWQDDNVRVVCGIVRTIIENELFSEKEMLKLCKEL